MEKNEITLSFDSERMRALTIYLKMESTTVQEKMDEAMRQLYEKSVPEPVREYLCHFFHFAHVTNLDTHSFVVDHTQASSKMAMLVLYVQSGHVIIS